MCCMAIKIKQAILPLICFLFMQSAYSQSAQDMQDYLEKQFLRYTGAYPGRALCPFRQEEYIAGRSCGLTCI